MSPLRTETSVFAAGLVVALLALLGLGHGCAARKVPGPSPDDGPAPTEVRSEANPWGIEILGVRQSAAGTMLDLRYRILDPEKAAYLVDRRIQPYLIHEESGARLGVPSGPTVGPMRQTLRAGNPPEGRVLFILFANPNRFVHKGDDVTLVIGDFRADRITVQ